MLYIRNNRCYFKDNNFEKSRDVNEITNNILISNNTNSELGNNSSGRKAISSAISCQYHCCGKTYL